ncbi:transcriptional regulator with XRE-family HTH domain [Caldalkalibacillus uzonensis]|uniref:Transcriptional regulator with XRE-family HTH domain n=1 Tax=Caldalkalibacillus uzonensis TaxID=353224 RepID=A0ABU0CXC0_9BACI|nr:transcriptional regulator with XRE-family HTH domain [Caldalkalibacillus uzonensis]
MKGYTQKELARALHVSVSVLGAVERGYKAPSPEFLAEIAQVLEVDLQELKGDMDQENGERGDNDDASNRPY